MYRPMNRIKEVLEERGIKQTWLAEKLGKSFCMVNSYVCNRRQPSLEVLFEIAKILNVNPKELIDSDDSISINARPIEDMLNSAQVPSEIKNKTMLTDDK